MSYDEVRQKTRSRDLPLWKAYFEEEPNSNNPLFKYLAHIRMDIQRSTCSKASEAERIKAEDLELMFVRELPPELKPQEEVEEEEDIENEVYVFGRRGSRKLPPSVQRRVDAQKAMFLGIGKVQSRNANTNTKTPAHYPRVRPQHKPAKPKPGNDRE